MYINLLLSNDILNFNYQNLFIFGYNLLTFIIYLDLSYENI